MRSPSYFRLWRRFRTDSLVIENDPCHGLVPVSAAQKVSQDRFRPVPAGIRKLEDCATTQKTRIQLLVSAVQVAFAVKHKHGIGLRFEGSEVVNYHSRQFNRDYPQITRLVVIRFPLLCTPDRTHFFAVMAAWLSDCASC
jgi:hypothetical protein